MRLINSILIAFNVAIIVYSVGNIANTSIKLRWLRRATKLLEKVSNLREIGALSEEEALQMLVFLFEPTKQSVRAVEAELRRVLA